MRMTEPEKSKKYYGSGIAIKNAINKYGKENFKKEILESGIVDYNLLCEREKYWIKAKNTRDPIGYNLTDGGIGILNPQAEVRAKMYTKRKKRECSEETRKKISLANSGRKASDDTRAKMRAAATGRVFSEEHKKNMAISFRKRFLQTKLLNVLDEIYALDNCTK